MAWNEIAGRYQIPDRLHSDPYSSRLTDLSGTIKNIVDTSPTAYYISLDSSPAFSAGNSLLSIIIYEYDFAYPVRIKLLYHPGAMLRERKSDARDNFRPAICPGCVPSGTDQTTIPS